MIIDCERVVLREQEDDGSDTSLISLVVSVDVKHHVYLLNVAHVCRFAKRLSLMASIAVWLNCGLSGVCLLYTSPSPRDRHRSRMPSSA